MLQYLAITKRICVGFCVVLTGFYINCISQVLIERYYLTHALRTPLFDLGFEFLPFLANPRVADGMLGCAIAFMLVPLLIFHPKRSQVARRFLVVSGCIYLARAFSIIATILPNPERTCKTAAVAGTDQENVFIEALKILGAQRVTCGDCLFSGHTAAMNLTAMFGNRYGRHFVGNAVVWGVLRTLLWIYCAATFVLIVCTHFHYTIDVIVAVMVSTAIWKWYHSYIKYIHELPEWHPIVWYEFDIRDQEAGTTKYLDDPEAPLLLSMKFN